MRACSSAPSFPLPPSLRKLFGQWLSPEPQPRPGVGGHLLEKSPGIPSGSLPRVWAGVEGQGELRWKEKGFLALPPWVLLRASAASGYFTHTLEYTSPFFKGAITGQGAKCSKCDSALGPSHHEMPGTGLLSQVSSEADPEWGSRKTILKRWETDLDQRKYFPILRP